MNKTNKNNKFKKLNSKNKNNEFVKKDSKSSFSQLVFFYYKKYKLIFFLMIFLTICSSICAILIPKLTQKIMQTDVLMGPIETFYEIASIIFFFLFLRGILSFFSTNVGGKIGKKIEVDLRNELLTHLTNLDMSFYNDKKMGETLTKMISDTEIIGTQSQTIPQSIISAIFTSVGAIIIMFTINVKLTLISIALCLFAFIVLTIFFITLKKKITKTRAMMTRINGDITDRLSNITLIKSSGTEKYEKERFEKLHNDYYDISKTQVKVQSLLVSFLIFILSSLNVLILVIGIILVRNHNLYFDNSSFDPSNPSKYYSDGIGIVVAAMMGINTLILPIMGLSRTFIMLAQASVAAKRVNEILEVKSLINNNYESNNMIEKFESIIFDNLTFTYPNTSNEIFKNFNYKFEKGKSYAFVGETGVGKSTISKLLLRFYDPVSGNIYINEKDNNLKQLNLFYYLKNIGYVEQEPSILAGTFLENIKYGNFEATNNEVIVAAKKAKLHNFIISLKDGYNTFVGENGFTLSGGQKQRLVIARMFLKNPDILILDEATSALDNIVEKSIQKNIEELMQNRTTFIIAHRLTTIQNVDQILVLEKNKGIVQVGTFDELIKIPGIFQNLYKAGFN